MLRLMSVAGLNYFEALAFPADVMIDLLSTQAGIDEEIDRAARNPNDDEDEDDVPLLPNGRPWPKGAMKLRRMLGG